MARNLRIDEVVCDDRFQLRTGMDDALVSEYAEDLREGAVFPPITVVTVEGQHFIVGGFHRFRAHDLAGRAVIAAEITEGTFAEAIRAACGENAKHGKRRTGDDKRKAIRAWLQIEPQASDGAIALGCKVSRPFVSRVRAELAASGEVIAPDVRISATGKEIRTAGITEAQKARHRPVRTVADVAAEWAAEVQETAKPVSSYSPGRSRGGFADEAQGGSDEYQMVLPTERVRDAMSGLALLIRVGDAVSEGASGQVSELASWMSRVAGQVVACMPGEDE